MRRGDTLIRGSVLGAVLFAAGCVTGDTGTSTDEAMPPRGDRNNKGWGESVGAPSDQSNPFFASLGINGRTCGSCHVRSQGWSITPMGLRQRFQDTNGMDPVFRLVDGADSPLEPVGTLAEREAAYSMLLDRGLIRVGLPIPPGADFRLAAVDDPHGYASAAELSLFRRPLPTTNVSVLATVMWDGRETHVAPDPLHNLKIQAGSATVGHAEATQIDQALMDAIADMQMPMFSAQIQDLIAGDLDSDGALGGPWYLEAQEYYFGINDTLGADPNGRPFNPVAMTLFDAWGPPANSGSSAKERRRASIFRGQQLFNTRAINITGVGGLNDALGIPSLGGTCTTCHDAPNIGHHSVPLPINIGTADASRRTPGMPLYTLERISDGARVQTTDPGRALITGRFADIGKFKGPILRGIAMRAPYFHNGMARTIEEAISFYDTRFGMGLTTQEKADLAAFLNAL